MSPKGDLTKRAKSKARNPEKLKLKHVEIGIYGRSNIVKRFIHQVNKEKDLLTQYNVSFVYAKDKRMSSGVDLIICLFDVCDSKSLTYLKEKAIPKLTMGQNKLAIGGMGVENRRMMGHQETNFGACMQLARDLECPGTELISNDAALWASMPEFIQTTSVNAKLEYLQIPQKDNEFLVNVAEPAGLDLKA